MPWDFKQEGTTMPVSKNKSTTSNIDPGAVERAASLLPEQHTFHEHLRALTRNAVRVVIEEVMREELKQFLGAAWGESTPERKGYRNGTYTRDLATSSGPIEDLEVPRDREGEFHTQVFDRYQRYEPQVAKGLTQMFVAGVSTQKVGEVAQTLMGASPSASSVSRLNQTLTQQFETWRERPLQAHWRIVYLDGIHFTVRHGRANRFDHPFNGSGSGSGMQQRGAGLVCLCRRK
jgi:putative transposase